MEFGLTRCSAVAVLKLLGVRCCVRGLLLKNELGDPHFLLSNCNEHDKMQLFAKFN